ncbi:MAG: Rne/Rng family ribonuclease [Candidatus Electrothrix aestuarii]|uniref:Ribonuclease G n=1 Tax=Candidatus Electrothrix aestuarii TaxID=3062594 RepID=A0AAU8M254_9BACT|nr:Rne/Rng family ribonuclease [Candidatus Electrothrix aestuarii]WPD24346.1 MAG: Rne/Rng family ribonuclease [Candidatus Electrothrix sp. GW3-3]
MSVEQAIADPSKRLPDSTRNMYTDIVINATPYENRIAVVERGNLLEFHLERPSEKGLVGNIYQGKVVRVLPGMQAAFVDIGLERTGFLYVDDIDMSMSQLADGELSYPSPVRNTPTNPAIEDMVKEGQTILVQIAKEPIGSKGARLTCHITLPCRNLVFMPLTDHIGISRKIEDEEVRDELRQKIERLRPEGTGFIVRTVAENVTAAEIEADMEFLLLLWDDIRSHAQRAVAPSLIYKDLDLVLRAVRDLFTESVNELVVDSQSMHERLLNFVMTFAPKLKSRIVYYDSEVPIFDAYGIEVNVGRAIDKKVWLRSGGYLIIETTEALTVVDVNTGRYVGKNNLNETIFKTNMEAVEEIAYQLRLRNIGGIIIIDFIDMEIEQHRDELYDTFQEAMRKDKNRVNILKVSEFGLVQMTRKRSSESLSQLMCEPCFYCGGEGIVKSRQTICYEIFRKIYRDNRTASGKSITIRVHPHIAATLSQDEAHHLRHLEKTTGKEITVSSVHNLHVHRYQVVWDE